MSGTDWNKNHLDFAKTVSAWVDKLILKLNQVRPGLGTVLEWVKRNHMSVINEMAFEEKFSDMAWREANDDIWAALTDKTTDQIRRMIKTAAIGFDTVAFGYSPGIDGFRRLHRWAVEMSGRTVTRRRAKLMNPERATSEATIMRQVEDLETQLVELED